MNALLPTSANEAQPVEGARPPWVFSRWTKLVSESLSPPVGPSSRPTALSLSQATAPFLTNLGSVEAPLGTVAAQTELVSLYCHVARIVPPGATTFGSVLGSSGLGLKLWVMTCPPSSPNRVASGVKST